MSSGKGPGRSNELDGDDSGGRKDDRPRQRKTDNDELDDVRGKEISDRSKKARIQCDMGGASGELAPSAVMGMGGDICKDRTDSKSMEEKEEEGSDMDVKPPAVETESDDPVDDGPYVRWDGESDLPDRGSGSEERAIGGKETTGDSLADKGVGEEGKGDSGSDRFQDDDEDVDGEGADEDDEDEDAMGVGNGRNAGEAAAEEDESMGSTDYSAIDEDESSSDDEEMARRQRIYAIRRRGVMAQNNVATRQDGNDVDDDESTESGLDNDATENEQEETATEAYERHLARIRESDTSTYGAGRPVVYPPRDPAHSMRIMAHLDRYPSRSTRDYNCYALGGNRQAHQCRIVAFDTVNDTVTVEWETTHDREVIWAFLIQTSAEVDAEVRTRRHT